MILGMSVSTFTLVHVLLSLIGIFSGLVVVYGFLKGRLLGGWNGVFLVTTIATSATGFLFHSAQFGPPHFVGIISLVLLGFSVAALYAFNLAGPWRWIYTATATLALYLNVFVGVVQAFQKVSFLQPLAPTQSEPPFAIAQGIVLVIFLALAVLASKRLRALP
ncbi:MAG TPA: hypothetical protein VHQ21_04965 [Rhodanobacteraceae bacterium]|nr:hypothetical protein [Rhodanobacteraceae bacterium]